MAGWGIESLIFKINFLVFQFNTFKMMQLKGFGWDGIVHPLQVFYLETKLGTWKKLTRTKPDPYPHKKESRNLGMPGPALTFFCHIHFWIVNKWNFKLEVKEKSVYEHLSRTVTKILREKDFFLLFPSARVLKLYN